LAVLRHRPFSYVYLVYPNGALATVMPLGTSARSMAATIDDRIP
jgi:hypothetical protein